MLRAHGSLLRALLVFAMMVPSVGVSGEEPTPVFVADIQFTGFPDAELQEMDGWPAAFAAEVKGALGGTAGLTPMTLENLKAQLGKERLKATFACEDAACVNRIVENFGCSETIFTVVRRIGTDKVQITMDHTAGETVLYSAAPVYSARNFDAIRGAVQELGGKVKATVEGEGESGLEAPPTGGEGKESGLKAPPTVGKGKESGLKAPPTVAKHQPPFVTSPEWMAARFFVGSHASGSIEPYSLLISAATLRWRWFYFTPAQLGLCFQKWSSDLIFNVGPSAGVPFHFGRDERHEVRLGAWIPLVIWDGDLDGMAFNLEAVYVYHFHEWFSVHAGLMGGIMSWEFSSADFMGGGIIGFGI